MILNKALLIKGLVGTTSALGISAGAYFGRDHISELFRTNKGNNAPGEQADQQQPQQDEEPQDADALIKKLSLTCNGTDNTECTITEGEKINIKHENTKSSDNSSSTTSTEAKIKLYKETTEGNYNKNLKLTIEGGDISLTGGTESSITKLEEFETYEIKKDDDDSKWYLSRKDKAEEGKKKALGLGDITNCSLPTDENTPQTCSSLTAEQIKTINFEGKTENGVTVDSNATATLTITKVSNSDSDFPNGYKLSLQPTQQVTITNNSGNITLKANEKTEFKIKKSGSSLTLEKAWTLDTLLKKVGLSGCTATENSNNECSIGNSGLNVKQDSEKLDSKTKDTTTASTGKIKVSTAGDNENYEHGFKFTIEDGDINLTDSKKLEQFETYEIKKEENENKWFFSRKKDALEEKKRILGLPTSDSDCKLPSNNNETKTCSNITEEQLKAIKFEGKGTNEPTIENSGTVTLTITKSSDSEFSDGGYKFSFNPTQDVTISTSSSIKIMKNTNTEFKIKKEGNTLSLEKAWSVAELAKQAGLTCTSTDNNNECSLGDKINVIFDNSGCEYSLDDTNKAKKIKYEENVADHNQGFKFYAEDDITFTGESDSSKKIEKKENDNGATYEIKKNGDKWCLSKVTPSGNA